MSGQRLGDVAADKCGEIAAAHCDELAVGECDPSVGAQPQHEIGAGLDYVAIERLADFGAPPGCFGLLVGKSSLAPFAYEHEFGFARAERTGARNREAGVVLIPGNGDRGPFGALAHADVGQSDQIAAAFAKALKFAVQPGQQRRLEARFARRRQPAGGRADAIDDGAIGGDARQTESVALKVLNFSLSQAFRRLHAPSCPHKGSVDETAILVITAMRASNRRA